MMVDLSGLVYMAVFGLVVLFGAVFPAIGAGLFMLVWHAFTNDWLYTAGLVGAAVGLIPGGSLLFSMIWAIIRGLIEERNRNGK